MRDPSRLANLRIARVGAREANVVADRTIEQEVVLHHDAELPAILAQPQRRQVLSIDQDSSLRGPVERHHQPDEGALPRAARAHQRRRRAGGGVEGNVAQHRCAGIVLEAHVIERDIAVQLGNLTAPRILGVLRSHLPQLANAVEPGERLADLRADRCDLHQRRRHQPDEEDVHHEVAERHRAGENGVAAEHDQQHPHSAHDHGREGAHRRDAGDGCGNVAEETVYTLREHDALAPLRRVDLHGAHAAQRFAESAGHLRLDPAALPEDRSETGEGERHHAAERQEDDERDRRELPVQPEQHPERDRGREQTADELHQTGTDQIPDPFCIVHDAGDQHAALRGIEVGDREAEHVRFDRLAHVGDRALRRNADDLRQRESRPRLNQRRDAHGDGEHRQQ